MQQKEFTQNLFWLRTSLQVLALIKKLRTPPNALVVNQRTIALLALKVQPHFLDGDIDRIFAWVKRFVKRNKDVLAMRTITSKSVGVEDRVDEDDIQHFLREAAKEIEDADMLSLVLNCDETGIWFEMVQNRTYDIKGRKVRILSSKRKYLMPRLLILQVTRACNGAASKKRFTAVLTVAASGQKLKPFLIFSAKTNGTLAARYRRDGDGYPASVHVAYQESAWMDGVVMQDYVNKVYDDIKNLY